MGNGSRASGSQSGDHKDRREEYKSGAKEPRKFSVTHRKRNPEEVLLSI